MVTGDAPGNISLKVDSREQLLSDMGTFRTSIAIENPARRGELRSLSDVLVDTGSETLSVQWLPERDVSVAGAATPFRDP